MIEPSVTVICITYNQKDYIGNTIEYFINQKVNFRYKIIIHDDASNDGTTEIVKSYAKKYPGLVVPVIEKYNRYSKNEDFMTDIIYGIDTKYVASCDGDDYWIDENKLQTQVDCMESHPEYIACGTESIVYNCVTKEESLFWGCKKSHVIDPNIILGFKRLIIKPSSFLYRTDKLIASRSLIIQYGILDDIGINLWLAHEGPTFFISKPMVLYHYLADGSWTSKHENNRINYFENLITLYDRYDAATKYEHKNIIAEAKERLKYKSIAFTHNYKELKFNDWINIYKLGGFSFFKEILASTPFGEKLKKIRHVYTRR